MKKFSEHFPNVELITRQELQAKFKAGGYILIETDNLKFAGQKMSEYSGPFFGVIKEEQDGHEVVRSIWILIKKEK